MPALASFVVLATGCTHEVFTPPARPMPLTGAAAPALGKQDMQLDVSSAGEFWGPGIDTGNLRYRHGFAESTALTVDAGLVHVDGQGDSYKPQAGVARVGVHKSAPATDDLDMAGFAGLGGGHAWNAGSWVSGDAGFAFTGGNKWVRPTFVGDLFLSQPFATHTFMADSTELRLPRTWGWQLLLGLELGQRDDAVIAGMMIAQLFASANDTQGDIHSSFMGFAVGVRVGDI